MHDFWLQWGFPVTGLILGIVGYVSLRIGARRFDQKYGRDPKPKNPEQPDLFRHAAE